MVPYINISQRYEYNKCTPENIKTKIKVLKKNLFFIFKYF